MLEMQRIVHFLKAVETYLFTYIMTWVASSSAKKTGYTPYNNLDINITDNDRHVETNV